MYLIFFSVISHTIREMPPNIIYAEMADTLELIKTLSPELREEIYKKFIKIKLRQRKALGWDEVNAAIKEAPFCDRNQQIVKVMFCYKCSTCQLNGLCNLCRRNGVKNYLGYPIYDEDDYDEAFKKFYSTIRFAT